MALAIFHTMECSDEWCHSESEFSVGSVMSNVREIIRKQMAGLFGNNMQVISHCNKHLKVQVEGQLKLWSVR